MSNTNNPWESFAARRAAFMLLLAFLAGVGVLVNDLKGGARHAKQEVARSASQAPADEENRQLLLSQGLAPGKVCLKPNQAGRLVLKAGGQKLALSDAGHIECVTAKPPKLILAVQEAARPCTYATVWDSKATYRAICLRPGENFAIRIQR